MMARASVPPVQRLHTQQVYSHELPSAEQQAGPEHQASSQPRPSSPGALFCHVVISSPGPEQDSKTA